ncbi:MAG: AEC family transporter [Desulfobacterota bacterium]|nr:AEC family transporter [Thermodesulfobacteriota bacterium]
MSPVSAFAVFQAVIILPFGAGVMLRRRVADPEQFTRRLLRLNITLIEPLIVIWCVWGLQFSRDLVLMPIAGLGLAVCGLIAGIIILPLLKLPKQRAITFLVSATLSNHGFTMGGFLCYLFFGERGLGLSIIMVLYFIPYLYGFVFPSLKAITRTRQQGSVLRDYILDTRNMPLAALAVAALLQGMDIERPTVAFPVDAFLALSIALYYLTVGMNVVAPGFRLLLRQHLVLAAIKFIAVPAAAAGLLNIISIEQNMKAVILLQSCMPSAVYSVVTAVLFGLDARFASSLFVVNTAVFLCAVLPVVWVIS